MEIDLWTQLVGPGGVGAVGVLMYMWHQHKEKKPNGGFSKADMMQKIDNLEEGQDHDRILDELHGVKEDMMYVRSKVEHIEREVEHISHKVK